MSQITGALYGILGACVVIGAVLAGIDHDWSEMIWVICAGIWMLNVFLRELTGR